MRLTAFTSIFALLLVGPLACSSDPEGSGGEGGSPATGGAAGNATNGGGIGGQSGGKATVGRSDDVAKHACDAWAGSGGAVASKTLNAVEKSDYAELAQAKLAVDGGTLYTINLPAGKESWVAVDENFWGATLGFFAPKGVAYEVRNSDMRPETDGPLKNGACPNTELTDYRVFFEHWTPATIRFSADGPRQVKFMIMRDEANSLPVPQQ